MWTNIPLNIIIIIVLLFFVSWLLIIPLKKIFKILINSMFGIIALFLFNLLSGYTGIYIGINIVTALIIGVLGVPGFLLLLILNIIL